MLPHLYYDVLKPKTVVVPTHGGGLKLEVVEKYCRVCDIENNTTRYYALYDGGKKYRLSKKDWRYFLDMNWIGDLDVYYNTQYKNLKSKPKKYADRGAI